MLARLERALAALPQWLHDPDLWYSMDVNYHPPRVERLYRKFEDGRIFLHCIYPCGRDEALIHPHPWPSAMLVLSGRYRTIVGAGAQRKRPVMVMESMVSATPEADYRYTMDNPAGWHSVIPEGGPVYSIMVAGPRWSRWIPEETLAIAGRLTTLTPNRVSELLETVAGLYAQHQRANA